MAQRSNTPVTVPVTFTVTAAPVPAIAASPTSLAFTAIEGGSNPAAQTLSISNTGGGTLNWRASEHTGWLTLSAGTGSGNGTVTLQATTGALAPGTHTGTVILSGGTRVTPVTIPVSFTVTAAPVRLPSARPHQPRVYRATGGSNPPAQTLTVSNTGSSTLRWGVSHDATWLWHTPGKGMGAGAVTIGVTPGSLPVGTYNGRVTLWPNEQRPRSRSPSPSPSRRHPCHRPSAQLPRASRSLRSRGAVIPPRKRSVSATPAAAP